MDGIRKAPPLNSKEALSRPSLEAHLEAHSKRLVSLPQLPKKGGWSFPLSTRSPFTLFLGILLGISLLFIGTLGFLGYKAFSVSQKVRYESTSSSSVLSQIKDLAKGILPEKHTLLHGEENGRINILLLGRAGEHYPGRNLTDTIMVASIDTETKKVALLSLPRDLYVEIPNTHLYTKINALYQYGLDNKTGVVPIEEAVETITGEKIHYFFVLDFDGFEKAIDTLGGVHVDVVKDFYDTRYPGKNYSYETFELKKGWQTLDGKTALKYVRERHDDPDGDFGRAKRQQQIIQAVKDKAFSVGTFLNPFVINGLLDTLGESIRTDIPPEDIQSFIELSKSLDTKNTTTVVIDAWKKESLLRVSHIMVGSTNAFILVPRTGNWSEVQDVSKNIFALDTIKRRREAIQKEAASLAILYRPQDFQSAKKISELAKEEFGIQEVSLTALETFENSQRESIIVDRSSLSKPFSLDELLKKLPLTRKETLQASLSPQEKSDFILFLGNDLAEELSFEESAVDPRTLDDNLPTEPFLPQPKR